VGRPGVRGAWITSLSVVSVVAAALAVAGPASASDKLFSLSIATTGNTFDSVAGEAGSGQAVTITAIIGNDSGTQQLGSANLGVPTGLVATAASVTPLGSAAIGTCTGAVTGPCVKLRNLALAPGRTAVVTIGVDTQACAEGLTPVWPAEVKQANNFSGSPGNNLQPDSPPQYTDLDGACVLAFQTQPHDAAINQPLTSLDWDTGGAPVTVQVLDGTGAVLSDSTAAVTVTLARNPGAAALSGGSARPADGTDGTATFAGLTLDRPANGYELAAGSGTLTGATSNSFDVAGTSTSCSAGNSCKTNTGNAAGSGQVVANLLSGTGTLLESANANSAAQLACSGYKSTDQNTYSYLTTAPATEVLTIMITSVHVSGSVNKFLNGQQICFGSTLQFTTSDGASAAGPQLLPDGLTSGYIGLLPNCTGSTTGPCHDRNSDKATPDASNYDITLVADIPSAFSGDPWSR
jgi:hypothetical protein